MRTKIYGCSDDLIEIEGDIEDEVVCYGTDDREYGVLLFCSDGTILEVKYGKGNNGIWGIMLHTKGNLFDRIVPCNDSEEIDSDVAYFNNGLKWIYAATEWNRMA